MSDEIRVNDLTESTEPIALADEVLVEVWNGASFDSRRVTGKSLAKGSIYIARATNVNLLATGQTTIIPADTGLILIPTQAPILCIKSKTGAAGTNPVVNAGTVSQAYKNWSTTSTISNDAVGNLTGLTNPATRVMVDLSTDDLKLDVATAGTGYSVLTADVYFFFIVQ